AEVLWDRSVEPADPRRSPVVRRARHAAPRGDPEPARLASASLVSATEGQARRPARGPPRRGQLIAVLAVPAEGPMRWEKTCGPGRHTLWCPPVEGLAAWCGGPRPSTLVRAGASIVGA